MLRFPKAAFKGYVSYDLRTVDDIRLHPSISQISPKVLDGYVCKPLKSRANFNWSALADEFRTFLLGTEPAHSAL